MFSLLISCLCNVNVDDLWPVMEQEKKQFCFFHHEFMHEKIMC